MVKAAILLGVLVITALGAACTSDSPEADPAALSDLQSSLDDLRDELETLSSENEELREERDDLTGQLEKVEATPEPAEATPTAIPEPTASAPAPVAPAPAAAPQPTATPTPIPTPAPIQIVTVDRWSVPEGGTEYLCLRWSIAGVAGENCVYTILPAYASNQETIDHRNATLACWSLAAPATALPACWPR